MQSQPEYHGLRSHQIAGFKVSDFKIFRGGMPPDPPGNLRAFGMHMATLHNFSLFQQSPFPCLKRGTRKLTYLFIGHCDTYFVQHHSDSTQKYTEVDIKICRDI